MWWVKGNADPSRGGFQNRDVGRASFNHDLGPDFGVDYARFADPPDHEQDFQLARRVNFCLAQDFPEEFKHLEVLVRNGFVIIKGEVADVWTKEAILEEVSALRDVREVIHQLVH